MAEVAAGATEQVAVGVREAAQLAGEVGMLRSVLRWRTWAMAVLAAAIGFAVAAAIAWAR